MIDLKKIDMHIHTIFSDGESTPSEIVRKAKISGYEVIAITDHDGVNGIPEALEAGRREGLRVVPGIELATETEAGVELHILGYGMDIRNPEFTAKLQDLSRARVARNEKLVTVLADMGYDISMKELMEKQPGGYIGKPVIARMLAEKGYISDYTEAFRPGSILESPRAKTVHKEKLLSADAVRLLGRAGGAAVLAHPIQARNIGRPGSETFYRNIGKIIADLRKAGLKGLECYHPDQNREQSERFVKIAEENGLFVSRGSDFHGNDYFHPRPTA